MNASLGRRRSPERRLATGGTILALSCAQSVYSTIDRRAPEACTLASWLTQSAAAFALTDAALPSDGEDSGRSRRRGITFQDGRRIGDALDLAAAGLSNLVDGPAERWIAAIGKALELDPLATRILTLALYYRLDQRVERLFDGMSECRGGRTTLHRDARLIALLLQAPIAEVAGRLTTKAKLLASGLLRIERHGDLSVLDRLLSLIRQDVPPGVDFYDQLLGSIASEPLPWEAFTHLGREAEVAASVLRAALVRREAGGPGAARAEPRDPHEAMAEHGRDRGDHLTRRGCGAPCAPGARRARCRLDGIAGNPASGRRR
jgi:transitional endoplasmic reticulum ATPase